MQRRQGNMNGMMMNSGGGQGQQMMMGNNMGRTMSSPQGQMGRGQGMTMGNNNMGRMGQQMMPMPGQMGGRQVMMGNNNMGRMGQQMMPMPGQMMMGGGQTGNQMGGMTTSNSQATTMTSSSPQSQPTGHFYEASFPANTPLGLTLEDGNLSYSVNVGDTASASVKKIQVVTIASVQAQNTAIQPGDMIVSINDQPTVNLPDSQGDIRKTPRSVALRIITEQQQMTRTLKMMRFRDPSVSKTDTVVRFDNSDVLAQLFDYLTDTPSSMSSQQAETTSYATYLAITFPPTQESLGLSLEPIRLTYKLEETGQYKTIDSCIVTSSSVSDHFRYGDILVKINGLALNSPTAKVSTNAKEQEAFCSVVANNLKNASRTEGRTVVVLRQVLAGEGDSQEAAVDHPELKPSLVLWREDEEIIYTNDFTEVEAENNHGHDHAHGHSHGHGGNCTMDHGHDAAGSHATDGHDHKGHDHGGHEHNTDHASGHDHGHSHGHGDSCTIDHGHGTSETGSHATDGHNHSHSHNQSSASIGASETDEIAQRVSIELERLRKEKDIRLRQLEEDHQRLIEQEVNKRLEEDKRRIEEDLLKTKALTERRKLEIDMLRASTEKLQLERLEEEKTRLVAGEVASQQEEESKKIGSDDAAAHIAATEAQRLEEEIQRRADEEMRKLRAAEEREREARQAVEVQRKLAEEAQQRAADMKRSLAVEMKRSADLTDEMARNQRVEEAVNRRVSEAQLLMESDENAKRSSIEDVIRERIEREAKSVLDQARELAREKQLEYEEKHRAAKKLQDDLLARVDTDIRTIIDQVRASRPGSASEVNDSGTNAGATNGASTLDSTQTTPTKTPMGSSEPLPPPSTQTPSLPPPAPVADIINVTYAEPGPLGFRLDIFSLTSTTGNADTTTKYAVQVKSSSKIPQIHAGDILLSINGEGSLLVPTSFNSNEHMQSVVARLGASRPVILSVFRCPALSLCCEKGLTQATLTAEESSVLHSTNGNGSHTTSKNSYSPDRVNALDTSSDSIPDGQGTIYEIEFPNSGPLGIFMDSFTVVYKDFSGTEDILHCCVVKDSKSVDHVESGDILVCVNGVSLVGEASQGSQGGQAHDDYVAKTIKEASEKGTGSRVLRFFKCASDTPRTATQMTIGADDAAMLLST